MRRGSNDKLHQVDADLNLTIRPESVGGTHANRFIHRPSNQLIIGPYFIDAKGNVRAIDVNQLVGRMTATAEHLTDPENKVLFYDMEGRVYEVDVHTLEVNLLFEKPVPGWHGKGAYTGQGHFIVANNGEHAGSSAGYEHLLAGGPATHEEEAGVLAEWDGEKWKVIARKKFTDVTGPGGLLGSPGRDAPIWSMGWDRQSVLLKVREDGRWTTFRLPKGSHTFDPSHGWYTEWPRIRQVGDSRYMMVMHGTMFDFPATFSTSNPSGIRPLSTHLRYIPDFTYWNGRVVLAADDASFLQNPMVGQGQSNLWFGKRDELKTFGPRNGWGGPWIQEPVQAGIPSDPFLIDGYRKRVLHLVNASESQVQFELEIKEAGSEDWQLWETISIGPMGYEYKIIPPDLAGEWMRIVSDKATTATAYFHMTGPRWTIKGEGFAFDGVAGIDSDESMFRSGVLRPAGHNRNLQVVTLDKTPLYYEVTLSEEKDNLVFYRPGGNRLDEVLEVAALAEQPAFEVDNASVIVFGENGERYRLPRGHERFDRPWSFGWQRSIREVVSERYLANIHGTFYEIPRVAGTGSHYPDYQKIKPVSSHDRAIADYCSWRGMLVLSGVYTNATEHDQLFKHRDGLGLWFGMIDDLWKLGKPVGKGGPWYNTIVGAGETSDPYLMTGYDEKMMQLYHDSSEPVEFTVEVAINHFEWQPYAQLVVPARDTLTHSFPDGYQAHWIRLRSARPASVTAIFSYY